MKNESDIKYQAKESYYKSIIKQLQDEIKELKLQLAKKSNIEYESSFEGYLRQQGYERINR